MAKIRNILLIGNAGKGKSTLANVLTGMNEFEENINLINGNNESKVKEFEHKRITYRVIDTVGIGISIQSTEEILSKLKDVAHILNEGLNQILFLTNGRFTKEEVNAFDLLRNAIFDDCVSYYTTIVITHFPKFQEKKICEETSQIFKMEIKKLSTPLASTEIIYVDNPPTDYGEKSALLRKASREILLNHLRTCQEVYQPKLLNKFHKMVDEFNTIIKDTVEAIKDIDSHFINSINYLGEFIPERRVIVKDIEMRIEEVKKYMTDRFQNSVISHSAMLFGKGLAISGIWFPPLVVPGLTLSIVGLLGTASTDYSAIVKENEAYKLFEKNLEMDKEKCEEVENLQETLRKSLEEFKNIRPRFVISEYRKQNIDRKKIEVIENIMEQILGKEIEPGVNPGKNDKAHSTGIKTVRATIEGVCKHVPSPLSFYCMYRDHKETKNRDSLRDMETIIENCREGLKVLEEKQQQLNNVYETIKFCKEEIAKLP